MHPQPNIPPVPDDTDSPHVGRHLLGPHVVGQRVVIRRVLRGEVGPSGGPALTDVLGVCTSWADSWCVVAPDGPDGGAPVRIAVADIVSGKPVPPRPSVRTRVSARDAESHTAALWPHLDLQPLGDWLLRSDPAPVGRLLKRANSALAMGDPGAGLPEALAEVERFYAERGRDALVQVEVGSDIETGVVAAGWRLVPGGEAAFMMSGLARAARLLRARGVVAPAALGLTLDLAEEGPGFVATLASGDGGDRGVVAVGRSGLDGDWLGLHGLVVEPGWRRRGLGLAVVEALLERGAERGARTAWLHVETDNEPARALYDGLGFDVHHLNRYYRAH